MKNLRAYTSALFLFTVSSVFAQSMEMDFQSHRSLFSELFSDFFYSYEQIMRRVIKKDEFETNAEFAQRKNEFEKKKEREIENLRIELGSITYIYKNIPINLTRYSAEAKVYPQRVTFQIGKTPTNNAWRVDKSVPARLTLLISDNVSKGSTSQEIGRITGNSKYLVENGGFYKYHDCTLNLEINALREKAIILRDLSNSSNLFLNLKFNLSYIDRLNSLSVVILDAELVNGKSRSIIYEFGAN